jgi:ergothioneine biosynthesis protein EgtB
MLFPLSIEKAQRMGNPLPAHSNQLADDESLASRLRTVRQATEALAAPLSAEDCALQSMPDASPVKWHLAHTSWFFETFLLSEQLPGYRPFDPLYRMLFNSYYNGVGARYPRPQRGLISRPGLAQVLAYRKHVDEHMLLLLERQPAEPVRRLIELGLQHEQQHQELILTDLKHLFSHNPLRPVYRATAASDSAALPRLQWQSYPGGIDYLGYQGEGFHFDNEAPRHRVLLEGFELASRLVTNGDYLAFMADDGYTRPALWLSDGWDTVCAQGWRAPLYWEERDGDWQQFTLAGECAIDLAQPVTHLSYYEAQAYAQWAGCRLPTEAEWEIAANSLPIEGNFVESGRLHPVVPPSSVSTAPQQMFGDVWEWTQSAYAPYPGYRPAPGAVGEYNGKFMVNQFVLRGGSCATPQAHIRPTYRNFFPPAARWQFSGIRLARDLR